MARSWRPRPRKTWAKVGPQRKRFLGQREPVVLSTRQMPQPRRPPSLALLGPGGWSVDARLFGWTRIDIRERQSRHRAHSEP